MVPIGVVLVGGLLAGGFGGVLPGLPSDSGIGGTTTGELAPVRAADTSTAAAERASDAVDACLPGQVDAEVIELPSPVVAEERFRIVFTSVDGVACTLVGAPTDLVFHDAAGTALDVASTVEAGRETAVVRLDELRTADVLVSVAEPDGPGHAATGITFTLPDGGEGLDFEVPWAIDLTGPVQLSPVG
ncbi:hypothetical protein UA75_19275 [Actinoalloteichus sp. GBA129-24]|uniref:DUF4232 domain-containing protein n=1 Tax=Actinoalloteichus fjordicus TaxID=1612552 RepID=A0AAC9PT73_9PSEU|nr:hypothetical protein UA74_18785 [Actinoalloteichus fjordicus]APU21845.1 hypothetical protein UA75_19275 [Actinoalloteichus sp. GBA129-24]